MRAAKFTVTDRDAPWRELEPGVRATAEAAARAAAARSPHGPTGKLAASWTVVPGRTRGVWVITNTEPYAVFVEYGTAKMPAEPMIGPVLAQFRAGAL